ncbi:pyridoxamine 5'-phosphate oxidase family protein [Hoeflea prorocentri]|uniref:Pyridoxamine 5'-phosphate oxidase family protein n=1 Tax=Hoeflea prorocentri TaxID=1922333 RepID=A0A9X3UFM2_9HYPH|nr:pyridoxamine 5'-phosphate oxidase family protein [Hoeflea prorocentri]MCY6379655.1 pyridoxamine 5'-phosphate oxidase family protein [Hoeflea prorocentri]MDA5397455.1 pyridoxamine 5'-phosphate oxidase family protein [Hoeflea prorocentri]
MDQEKRNQVVSIIDDVNDMTIATVRDDGFPQATTVSFMNDGLTLYFMTTSDSQKASNIAKNNRVSVTINRDYGSWDKIESLSMGGLALRVTDPAEQEKIGELLMEKFPEAAQYEPEDTDVELAFFRVEPRVVSLLDYSKGFGHTETLTV